MGWGIPNISYTNTAFDWTNRDPAEAGTLFGDAVAEGAMAYQLNSAIAAAVAALDDADITYDGTAGNASLISLNRGAAKFGDRQSAITAWVMHSDSMNKIWENGLTNSERLFQFGSVQIVTDQAGRPLIMTDSDALHFDNAGTENYIQLGLVAGGLSIEDQGDLRTYQVTSLEEENAKELMKVEGTFGLGIKGYTWNTAVTKPTDAEPVTLPDNILIPRAFRVKVLVPLALAPTKALAPSFVLITSFSVNMLPLFIAPVN